VSGHDDRGPRALSDRRGYRSFTVREHIAVKQALPTRWPPGARAGEAFGYLLARHIPAHELPAALRVIRQSVALPTASAADSHRWAPRPEDIVLRRSLLRWIQDARTHARQLGPPSGLDTLIHLLGDRVLRSEAAARTVLEAVGAADLANPTALTHFAVWCGIDLPYARIPVRTRARRTVFVYVPAPASLTSARAMTRAQLRSGGLVPAIALQADLAAAGLQVQTLGDPDALHDLLNVDGGEGWVWPRTDGVSVFTRAMRRIAILHRAIPVELIPHAVARTANRHRPNATGERPPPADGVRAWSEARPDWALDDDHIRPLRPPSRVHLRDARIVAAFAGQAP
jgi:hypothetical protein